MSDPTAAFSNFGATALGLAGTAYIVGETTKMLKNYTCRHCGSQHPSKAGLTAHYRYEHPPKRKVMESHASHKDDWEFDFRI